MTVTITSFSNPLVKRIKRLRQKKYRQQEGAFFVEGLRVVMAAAEAGAELDTLVYSSELLTSDVARRMVAEQRSSGVKCIELAAPVFKSISDRDHPVGLGAIVHSSLVELDDLTIRPSDLYVALVEVAEPGNLGTILRTIDATGATGLVLVGNTVDPFHPTAVKASMGAIFTVPVAQAESTGALLKWAAAKNLVTLATSARAERSFWEVDHTLPALLLLGSEREGLTAGVLASVDQAISIPMVGSSSSLNLAVAAGVLLYEIRRRSL